jgi:hypothetical protein
MTARRPTRRGVLRAAAALAAAGSLGGTALARTDERNETGGSPHRQIDAALRAATAGTKDLGSALSRPTIRRSTNVFGTAGWAPGRP